VYRVCNGGKRKAYNWVDKKRQKASSREREEQEMEKKFSQDTEVKSDAKKAVNRL
jgi:hypothetical protein